MIKKDIEIMMEDCANIDEGYSFHDLVRKNGGDYLSMTDFLYWFDYLWRYIPEAYLYRNYADIMSCINLYNWSDWYHCLFEPELLEKVRNLYVPYYYFFDDDNLDEEGYLTVYYGHCNRALQNHTNIWTPSKGDAIDMGRVSARLNRISEFYCLTARVHLDHIMAHINDRDPEIIVALNKNVQQITQDVYPYLALVNRDKEGIELDVLRLGLEFHSGESV